MKFSDIINRVPESKETLLRTYKPSDIPLLVEYVAKYVPELPNYENITVNKEWLANCLTRYYGNVSHFQSWVITDENDTPIGCSAGFCVTGLLTPEVYASDAFWFVLPNWRSLKNATKLMRAFKQWALARGAVMVTASQVSGFKEAKFEAIMEREGFQRTGSIYSMRMDTGGLARRLHELRSEHVKS